MKNPELVKNFETDSKWKLEKDQKFENISAGMFDTFCTRVRCSLTNRYLREEKNIEVKYNDYDMYSKLTPEVRKMTDQIAADFQELGIDFYPGKELSFVLSGGAELDGHGENSHHNSGRAIDLRTGDVTDIEKLKLVHFYLRNVQAYFGEDVIEFKQEEPRLEGYKKSEYWDGPHFHLAIEKDKYLEKVGDSMPEALNRAKKNTKDYQELWADHHETMKEIEKIQNGFKKFSRVFFEKGLTYHEYEHLKYVFFDSRFKVFGYNR